MRITSSSQLLPTRALPQRHTVMATTAYMRVRTIRTSSTASCCGGMATRSSKSRAVHCLRWRSVVAQAIDGAQRGGRQRGHERREQAYHHGDGHDQEHVERPDLDRQSIDEVDLR